MTMVLLKQCELFNRMSPEELKVLSALAQKEAFAPGSIIFSQNTLAEKVYLLDQGMVALKTSLSEGLEITYEMITKRGEPFGWSALVEPFRLTATAICLEKTRVISFHNKDLNRIFNDDQQIGYRVMKNLCVLIARRLHRARQLLAEQI